MEPTHHPPANRGEVAAPISKHTTTTRVTGMWASPFQVYLEGGTAASLQGTVPAPHKTAFKPTRDLCSF